MHADDIVESIWKRKSRCTAVSEKKFSAYLKCSRGGGTNTYVCTLSRNYYWCV